MQAINTNPTVYPEKNISLSAATIGDEIDAIEVYGMVNESVCFAIRCL